MFPLPDEILLHIISFLEPPDLVNLQHVSRSFLALSRDNNLWKTLCFEHSIAEVRRRRQLLYSSMNPQLAELARAMDGIANTPTNVRDPSAPSGEMQAHRNAGKKKAALLANWDPTYPNEKVNFYQEFVQRHAPHSISWFQNASHRDRDENLHHEATGMGILFDDGGMADKLVAPIEDGSISIWDASGSHGRQGSIIARSAMGLLPNKGSDLDHDTQLTQSKAIMTETGAVECVSIDNRTQHGFFAVQNILNEVDLRTLQVVSRSPYPFPITSLSEARHPTPLTVGTNWTLHLHDTRKRPSFPSQNTRCELISGSPLNTFSSRLQTGDFGGHVSLSQPGALSILHLPTSRECDGNGDIWVGGRFTSFLNYDRRFFPRLRGTVFSGARLSCVTALPHPFVPLDLRLRRPYPGPGELREAKSIPGHTLIAAGEYKGKGSLELYILSSDPSRSIISTSPNTSRNPHTYYHNRQTASSSKLLSVASHGTRLVFSDGDGNLKWVERDGFTPVRQFNINDEEADRGRGTRVGLEDGWGDIVLKITPTINPSLMSSHTSDIPLGEDNIIIWTDDGKLGVVGFGRSARFKVWEMEERAEEEREQELRNKERAYGAEMRKALEHQARELKWMRGYGL
ncbi:F-box domain-containing protein [Zopfia rhizophila CBS 207.26]|uniref:F-box domain-containing protein n=1 Tax=Zopfia rhizophila CBS 207.26 TaxID=1314779 RepID=A0A6A6DMW9_9PEZI|nr:F-box domain-containing protein [Zopfia rhizophila CBS 207.26]